VSFFSPIRFTSLSEGTGQTLVSKLKKIPIVHKIQDTAKTGVCQEF